MVPIKSGKYEYRPESLVEVRKQIGLSQAKMAECLGIPANSLWRWETGTTKPDAESLAAVYSVAMENRVTPNFFQRRRAVLKTTTLRSRLIVMWDFQNLQFSGNALGQVDEWIEGELNRRFPSASYSLYKAFASQFQSDATDRLIELGWKVWEGDFDMDDEIRRHAKSDCGQLPEETILVLITKDGDFRDLIRDIRSQGVEVYLITPMFGYSQSLAQEIGAEYHIRSFIALGI